MQTGGAAREPTQDAVPAGGMAAAASDTIETTGPDDTISTGPDDTAPEAPESAVAGEVTAARPDAAAASGAETAVAEGATATATETVVPDNAEHEEGVAPRRHFRQRERGWWTTVGATTTPAARRATGGAAPGTGTPGRQSADPVTGQPARPPLRYILALVVAVILIILALSRLFSGGTSNTGPGAAPTTSPSAFNPTGGAPLTVQAILGTGAGLLAPREAVAPPGGGFIVADTGNSRLAVLGASGRLRRAVRSGAAQLQEPFALVATSAGIDVLDAKRGTIEQYSDAGRFERELAHDPALGDGRGMAVGPTGELFVANPLINGLVILTPDGHIERKLTTGLSTAPGQFNQPSDVAVSRDGTIYVLDNVNRRIQALKPSGAFIAQWPAPASDTLHSVHLLALPDGRLLATDPSGALLVYARGVANPTRLPLAATGRVLGPVEPLGLAPLRGNKILLTDAAGNRLLIVPLPA